MSLNAVEIAIIMALIITAVMCIAHKYVNRYRWVVYLITLLVGAYFVLPNVLGYEIGWLSGRSPFKQAFTLGALSCMLFAVVAYVGVLPDKWKLKKRLKGIRAELSVMACILAFCHTMYFSYYFITFFTDPGSLNGYYIYACAASLVLDCLMVPLMITSFYSVRKYFKASTWKRLQQCSYIFYVALLVHVWGLYATSWGEFGRGDGLTLLIYTIVWGAYYVLRICKYLYDRKHKNASRTEESETQEVTA